MGRLIQIAMGSASEVDYLLSLAKGYFEPVGYETLATELEKIRKMLAAFYKRVRQVPQDRTARRFANS
jgi:four helix bundle protein